MSRSLLILSAALFLIDSAAGRAHAQEAFSLHVTVVDTTAAPLPGARVSVTPAARGTAVDAAVTSTSGELTLALTPGPHAVTVELDGFAAVTLSVTARTSGVESRTVTMHVASFTDTVNVSAPPSYRSPSVTSVTKTPTPLRDVPQSVTVVSRQLIADQLMQSVGDACATSRGQRASGRGQPRPVIIRGNNSSADFFVDGVRDDVQYFRDLYNVERVEALKGPNAMIFGRGGGGGVINRVTKEAGFTPLREISLHGGSFGNKRVTADVGPGARGRVGVPPERHVRELRQLPRLRRPRALRAQPDAHLRARSQTP